MSNPDYRRFAQKIMGDWPDVGDLDGFDLQELARDCGILNPELRTEPCDEGCNCDCEMTAEEMAEGFQCYRLDPDLMDPP